MRYLFIDNFRGFTKTLLQIKDINFFVGENSTGKTSILSLINLLSSAYFWFSQEFNTEEVQLGNFEDIVSITSPDRRYFRIGFIELATKKEGNEDITSQGFLLTFKREKGIPVISRYTYISGRKQVTIKFNPTVIQFKYEDLGQVSDDPECINRIFLSWVNNHQKDGGYKRLKEDFPFLPGRALVLLPAMLENIVYEKARERTIDRVFVPAPFRNIAWLAPIRTRPKRTYDSYEIDFSPEGSHIPYSIKKFLDRKADAQKFLQFVEKFGKASGLFESIYIKNYGRRATASPFELDIVLGKRILNIVNVGYGVSQSLPVIVELFARPKNTWFAIQQPEVHLHPRAQAAIGDMFFELAVMENKKFIIETHTDFIIDSFRLNYRKKNVQEKPDAQIVFFERSSEGNVLHQIDILENGELPDTQPAAFREFFVKEQMRLLGF